VAESKNVPPGDEENEQDLKLVEQILRSGTPEAFRPLYERYKDKVHNTAYRITGDATLAADVVHDVFVRVYERLEQFSFRSRFSSWLYRVAVNLATDAVRRRSRERWLFAGRLGSRESAGGVFPAAEDGPADAAESAETAEGVARAVAELSLKLREVVVLRYFEGLSYEEIAEVLGKSLGTVKSRLNRAHRKLGEKLQDIGEEGPW